jgi:hypothetical protein
MLDVMNPPTAQLQICGIEPIQLVSSRVDWWIQDGPVAVGEVWEEESRVDLS